MPFLGFGEDPSLPQLNTSSMRVDNNASAKKQSELATGLRTDLSKLNDPYKQNRHQTGVDYQNESRASADKFLNDIGSSSDKLGENLSTALYRRTMATQPQAQSALRESLAATGGLARGGADQAFVNQASETASRLSEGNNDIVNQQLQARQDAMKMVQGIDQGLIRDRLGIDSDTLAEIYASGRQDLINEANSLMGIESNRNATDLDLQTYGYEDSLARANGDANRRAGTEAALLGAAGTIGGAAIGGPVGAGAGNSLSQMLLRKNGMTTSTGNTSRGEYRNA